MVNKEYYKLGQKIRNFRLRAGKSQMDLELEIGASAGSISRIENGEVNPTKETLLKISNALQLNTVEIASIQNLELLSPEEVMQAISLFTRPLNLKEIIKNSVDVLFELYPEYNGGVLLLLDDENENILRARGVSEMPLIEKVYELLGGGVDKYFFDLAKDKESLITKTFFTGEFLISNVLNHYSKGSMSDFYANSVSKLLGFKIGITLPLDIDGKRIGVMLFTKKSGDTFTSYEQNILRLLSNQIAIAIMNGKKYESLVNNYGK